MSVVIDSTGAHAPDYATIVDYVVNAYKSIYGSDIYLEEDSQEFQQIAIWALAIYDSNQAVIAAYNSYSPSTAQGSGLSSVVKINGITRQVPSKSTVNVVIIGQIGTVINNGIAQDTLGNRWLLPSSVTIPISGTITVTATAQNDGNVTAIENSVNQIFTPVLGWQSVNNPAAATPGAPVETDAKLRQRQTKSTAIGSLTIIDGLYGLIADISGVQRLKIYENPTDGPDSDGIPEHSIAVVVQGGDSQEIVDAIGAKKTPGTGTYGDTSEVYTDPHGVPEELFYFTLDVIPITVEIDITAQFGYVSTTADAIKSAIANYISNLPIGNDVYFSKLYTVANLDNNALSDTYVLTSVKIARTGSPTQADVVIAFNEAASCIIGDITVVVS